MVYHTSRTLAQQSYQHWISSEVFTFGWFLTIFFLAVFYIVWIKLVDKSRLGQLLLLGALAGVGFIVVSGMVLNVLYGVAEYKIRPFPLIPAIFIVSVTKAPIIIMLVHQYTSTWKGYMLWTGIGMAFLAFVLYPIYSLVVFIKCITGTTSTNFFFCLLAQYFLGWLFFGLWAYNKEILPLHRSKQFDRVFRFVFC